ncbi:MAG: GNAT family N-acetyltransferase [Clostridia bacterium]|nr:GNAT family N-acetyltransferase [Clostridia bacterium]
MQSSSITYRTAERRDIPAVLALVRALAAYEHMEDAVVATEAQYEEWLFERRVASVLLACDGDDVIGIALYFYNFSTWLGRGGIYLEDLFVRPEYRGRGIGQALLRGLAKRAVAEGCGRVEWSCLDWNTPSIEFYRAQGAVPMDGWTVYRLTGEALETFAEEEK